MSTVRRTQPRSAGRIARAGKPKAEALKRRPSTRRVGRAAHHTADPPRAKVEKQFSVSLTNKPGQLARLGRLLQRAGVNILAMSISEQADSGTVRIIVSNKAATRRALDGAGLPFTERDVLLVRADNSPGAVGAISSTLARAKVNLDYAYASTHPDATQATIILAVDHTRKAVRALG